MESKEREGKLNFHVLPWPSQSPSENLWKIIKDALNERADRASNLDQLFQFIKEEWEKVPEDYLRNVWRTCQGGFKVIKNKGGSTSY